MRYHPKLKGTKTVKPGIKDWISKFLYELPVGLQEIVKVDNSYTDWYMTVGFDFLCAKFGDWIDCRSVHMCFSADGFDCGGSLRVTPPPGFAMVHVDYSEENIKFIANSVVEATFFNRPKQGCGCCICMNWGRSNSFAFGHHCSES